MTARVVDAGVSMSEHRNAKLLAIARMAWGHPSGRIRADLSEKGVHDQAIQEVVEQGKVLRHAAARRAGLVDAALGLALVSVLRLFEPERLPIPPSALPLVTTAVVVGGLLLAARGCYRILYGGYRSRPAP